MKEFNASTTFFSRISLDNLTVRVRRTRTRKSDYATLSLLFGVDCATGFFFCLPMHDLSAKSLISSLQVLFIKYAQPAEIITDAHATFVSLATNNHWPGYNIRPRAGGEQFSNFVESSIRVFKSFETLLNNDLYSSDLLQRLDIIVSVMNARPVKRISRGNAIFTLSPKELIMPLLSRANIRQNLLHVGAQLCQETSWTDYSEYKSDCQDLLQKHLLDFLYSESSWRYKVLSKSNVSKDKQYLTPQPLDIVAVKLDSGRDQDGDRDRHI